MKPKHQTEFSLSAALEAMGIQLYGEGWITSMSADLKVRRQLIIAALKQPNPSLFPVGIINELLGKVETKHAAFPDLDALASVVESFAGFEDCSEMNGKEPALALLKKLEQLVEE